MGGNGRKRTWDRFPAPPRANRWQSIGGGPGRKNSRDAGRSAVQESGLKKKAIEREWGERGEGIGNERVPMRVAGLKSHAFPKRKPRSIRGMVKSRVPKRESPIGPRGRAGMLAFQNEFYGLNSCPFLAKISGINPVCSLL